MPKSARNRRLESELQRVLAALIQREVRDPRVGAVTLTRVDPTADLAEARVGFVPFGASGPQDAAVAEAGRGLARAAGFLRGEVGRSLALRHAPRLVFEYDESIERASRLTELIDSAVRRDRDSHRDD